MDTIRWAAARLLFISMMLVGHGAAFGQAVGTAFTYQGELRSTGQPANGAFDFQFRLFNAATGGSQVGAMIISSSVGVSGGLFTVPLDFGPGQFAGDAQWLEIGVRASGSGTFETLTPRTAVMAAPYALGAVAALPNSVTTTSIVDGTVGSNDVNAGQIQRRVVGTCIGSSGVQGVAADGTVVCGSFAGNLGTVTSIQTGTGLAGGPITTSGTISIAPGGVGSVQINPAEVQARVSTACGAGQFVRAIGADGVPTCAADVVGTGTVTSVQTGAGLQGGPITGAGTIEVAPSGIVRAMIAEGAVGGAQVDSAEVQRRVVGACAVGQVITAINASGSVQCGDVPFTPRETLIRPATIGGAVFGTVGPDGLPYFLATNNTFTPTQIVQWVGCSNTACTGIPRVTRLSPSLPETSLLQRTSATWAGGLPLLVGTETTASERRVVIDYCADVNCSSKTSRTLASSPVNSVSLQTASRAVIVPADGRPAVIYRFQDSFTITITTHLAKCNDAACTTRTLSTIIDSSGPVTFGAASIVPTPGGGLLIAGGNGSIVTAPCADANCTAFGPVASVSADVSGPAFPFAASSAPDGRPIAVFRDGSNRVKVFRCADSLCASGQTTVVFGGPGDFASSASVDLAIGADSLPILSVNARVDVNSSLNVMHCADAACQAVDQIAYLTVGSLDLPNPIVVPGNGRPVIAAGNSATNFGATLFQFYACGSPTCQ